MNTFIFDIETYPLEGLAWRPYDTDIIRVLHNGYTLCWSGKWLGEKKVISSALIDFPLYKRDKRNDKEIMKVLWKCLDEADIVIGHNVDKFDVRKVNARFMIYGMNPPSPYYTVDTLKVARKAGYFDSNKLNDIAQYFGIGSKVQTGGIDLWIGCGKGDMKAWRKMIRYCNNDVVLTERVYLHLLPWITNHPSVVGIDDTDRKCTTCGSINIIKRGKQMVRSGLSFYTRYSCKDCGKWLRGKTHTIKNKEIR